MSIILYIIGVWILLGFIVGTAFGFMARGAGDEVKSFKRFRRDDYAHALNCRCGRKRNGPYEVDVECIELNRMLRNQRAQGELKN